MSRRFASRAGAELEGKEGIDISAIMILADGMTGDYEGFLPEGCVNLEQMKAQGQFGRFLNAPDGLAVDSLTCIMTLLGVPREKIPKGRAYFEALSQELEVGEDDLVLRCNFAGVNDEGILTSPGAGGLPEGYRESFSALGLLIREAGGRFYPMEGYKNLVTVRGAKKELQNFHCVPPHQHLGERADTLLPAGCALAERLAQISLASRCAFSNRMLLFWAPSAVERVPSFRSLHQIDGAAVAKTEIVRGIAKALGLAVATPPHATADTDTDLAEKLEEALGLLGAYPFVFLHINGADEAAHRQNPNLKRDFLRRIDRELVAPLLWRAPEKTRVLFCGDHGTSSATSAHLGGPQPFVLWEKGACGHKELGTLFGTRAVSLLCDGEGE